MNREDVLLLDTNILVALTRQGDLGKAIEKRFRLLNSPFRPLVCVVSIGEAMKLGKEFRWGKEKQERLLNVLGQFVWVDISRREVLQAYSDIAHFYEREAKPANRIGQNDYWIAATAKVSGATLLTTDKHFDLAHERFAQRIWIDPDTRTVG